MFKPNEIVCGDCIEILSGLTEPVADLVFADPPFNIGYKYDVYHDRKQYHEYFAWTQQWMAACYKALKPSGSFWVAIGDEYAAEIKLIGDRLGLHLRNWVIWHYTFGQNTRHKFARSHAHLFYWVKDPNNFTFNDMEVRIPSARQTTYADKRANPIGKIPDDVWSISRVCGTFLERVDWHPCQMPELVLERIIRVSSRPGDLVLDPFNGSGTTSAVAARLGRNYFSTDLSEKYVEESRRRIADTLAGCRPTTEISENPEEMRAYRKPRSLKGMEKGPPLITDVVEQLVQPGRPVQPDEPDQAASSAEATAAPRKRRGRRPKNAMPAPAAAPAPTAAPAAPATAAAEPAAVPAKRRPGRPRKNPVPAPAAAPAPTAAQAALATAVSEEAAPAGPGPAAGAAQAALAAPKAGEPSAAPAKRRPGRPPKPRPSPGPSLFEV